jgi:hypothetical protein
MHEIWLSVPGFEGAYEVSCLGRVRSLGRINGTGYFRKGTILKIDWRKHGYGFLTLMKNGVRHTIGVHEIVLISFIGPRKRGMESRHLDGNPLNNIPSNLRWGTKAENEADKIRHGTILRGALHPRSKLSEAQVKEIRRMLIDGINHTEIAEKFPVGRSQIGNIACGLSWA